MRNISNPNTQGNDAWTGPWASSLEQLQRPGLPRQRRVLLDPQSKDIYTRAALIDFYNRAHCALAQGASGQVTHFEVESSSRRGHRYIVLFNGTCDCPDYTYRRGENETLCKHGIAACCPDVAWFVLWARTAVTAAELDETIETYREMFASHSVRAEFIALAWREADKIRAELAPRPAPQGDPFANFD